MANGLSELQKCSWAELRAWLCGWDNGVASGMNGEGLLGNRLGEGRGAGKLLKNGVCSEGEWGGLLKEP